MDIIDIEILEDGTIKTTTDAVSAPNHSSAEKFLLEVGSLAGGKVTSQQKPGAKHHHHKGGHHHHHGGEGHSH